MVDLPIGSGPARFALGPDGNLWVTMFDASAIDRVTPAGTRTRFPLRPGTRPNDIAVGPDGALWFTGYGSNTIGRMTAAACSRTPSHIPTPGALPIGIAAGPDGAIWFTESGTDKIGRLQLDPCRAAREEAEAGGTVERPHRAAVPARAGLLPRPLPREQRADARQRGRRPAARPCRTR